MSGNNNKEDQHQITDCSESSINHTIQGFQDQLLLHHQPEMQHQNSTDAYFGVGVGVGGGGGGVGRSSLMFPSEVVSSPILPWTLPSPPPPAAPLHHHNDHPFFLPPPPTPSSSSYGAFFNRRHGGGGGVGVGGGAGGLQFGYDHHHHQGPSSSSDHHHHHHLRLISDSIGQVVQSTSAPFGLQAELQKMTAQEIMDAKALAASKSHSEAERRRRERINNHLAKLRSLLPNTTKTDKASLLAEVIQHVKELKRQTSLIAESSTVPTEMDELTVDNASSDEDGKLLIKASLCCEDRSDLLPDLIKTLKALRLRTLKAEITTLAGRVKNVLFITTEDDDDNDNDTDTNVNGGGSDLQQQHYSIISSIQEALKAVMEKASGDDQSASGSVKRQRTNINIYP